MAVPHRYLLPTLAILLLAPAVLADPPARTDVQGDPLPAGALARIGTTRFRDGNYISAVTIAPDGKSLAVASNQSVRILDLATGKELRTLKPTGFANFTYTTYSADGKLFAGGDYSGRIQFWDPATGEAAGQITPPAPEAGFARTSTHFNLSGDGKFVASSSDNFGGNAKAHVIVYEIATGKQTSRVEVMHNTGVRSYLSGDGKVLVTTGQYYPRGGIEPPEKQAEINSTAEVWDAATGKELFKLRSEGAMGVTNVTFSPDGKQLILAAAGGGLVVWDPATGKELRRMAGRRNLNAFIACSPDGKTIAAGAQNGTIQTWEAATGKRLDLYEVPWTQMSRVAFTKTGRLFAIGTIGQTISVWDVLAEKSLTPTGGHRAGITALGFTSEGKGLVSASWDGVVTFWDAAGKETRQVQLRSDGMPIGPSMYHIGTLQVSPDRKHILGSFNNGLSLFELGKGREVCAFSGNTFGYNPTATFSGDGRLMVEGLADSKTRKPLIRLFDVGSGQELRKFDGQTGDLRQLALSPDGKAVAAAISNFQPTGQINDLRLWDAATGKSLWHVDEAKAWLQGLAFSPNSKLLAAMDPFGAITYYETASGRELRRQAAQAGTINSSMLTFSPDGRLLAIAAYDATARAAHIRTYEVASGTLRHEFIGHDSNVTALAFSPDGKRMASGGNDTTILLWDLTDTGEEVAKGKPTIEELGRLWEGLTDADGGTAFKAMRRMEAAPAEAVEVLAKNLKPEEGKGAGDEITRLIAALDDDSFDQRQEAHKKLAAMGRSVEEPLKKALAAKPSAEAKRAIEDLLDKMKDKGQGPPPELLRPLRAVEVLEDLGTPEAKKLLEALSKGRAEAPLTVAAREALARMP